MAEADAPAPDENGAEPKAERTPSDIVTYWKGQLDAYDDEFKDWKTRCKKIIRRYRNERQEKSNGEVVGGARFNVLWSNVQTLQPAIYIKPPQPVVERRYTAKDPLARFSSMTLERALEVQIEVGKLHPAMQKAVQDYLLCGRGTVWERYEPTFGEPIDVGEQTNAEAPAQNRPVTYERVWTDYVAWDKFRHSPAAVWDDVWWVSKDEMLTRRQLRERFKGKDEETGKLIADLIPMRDDKRDDKDNDREKKRRNPKALVVEIWNKTEGEVIFIAPDWPNAPLETTADPLNLSTFWPCPTPLYATMTSDTLVPIPDYVEYQDQADELDDLTARIGALTQAVRVNGVYDASYPELKRILSEGVDNRMIGVKNYAEFASKGGIETAMDFVPIKDVVEALVQLYDARERTKQVLYEVTGISDILRGVTDPDETLGAQKIKGNFATLRLDDRKKEVARFARDDIAIKGEIISEQFSPEILSEMTGMIPFITEEIRIEAPAQPQMGAPLPASPGSVPAVPGIGAPGPVASPPQAGMQPDQLAQQKFAECCKLLKDDKLRTFRIDIETDSTIEIDRNAAKEAVVEMFTAIGGFLEKALPIGQAMPQLAPALGQSILFAFRTFGAGRDVEGVWEQAIDQMTAMAKNPGPKPPSPEEIKAQAEKQKMEMEAQAAQQQAQLDQQKAQQEFQLEQAKAKMELEREQMKLQLERERLEMEREKMQMQLQGEQQKAAIQAESANRQAALDEQAAARQDEMATSEHARSMEAGERTHELDMETAEFKAKEAKKPKVREPA